RRRRPNAAGFPGPSCRRPRRKVQCSRFSPGESYGGASLAQSRRRIQPLEDRTSKADLVAMGQAALQSDLFAADSLPEGFAYGAARIDPALGTALLREMEKLPFKPFEFRGFFGSRRIVSYGWRYDYAGQALRESDPMPDFLFPLRTVAASFAGLPAERF